MERQIQIDDQTCFILIKKYFFKSKLFINRKFILQYTFTFFDLDFIIIYLPIYKFEF